MSSLLCWALSPAAAAAPPALSQSQVERIERIITTEMSRGSIPGLSIAIVADLEERWANGYGLADVENFVPAKASTNYRYASIAKAIIATAIMQLVEAGKLDLDAPVQKYVPAYPKKQWTVTTRHLINNVSGVRAYQGDEFDSTKHYTNVTATLDVFTVRVGGREPRGRERVVEDPWIVGVIDQLAASVLSRIRV